MNAVELKLLKDKAKAVKDKVTADHGNEPFAVDTRFGEVQFESVEQTTDIEGASVVEVYLRGDTESGDPHFRIYNPPLKVKNPDGSYREDPVQALAEVIARHGGRRTKSARRS